MSLRDDNYLFINLLICITHTGPKFSISCDHVKVIDTTGMNISFETEESESTLLSSEVHTMWQHVKMVSLLLLLSLFLSVFFVIALFYQ